MPEVPLLVVDGTGLAWRAACGFPRRVLSRSGADITAVFGFFALLRKTHREVASASEIVVCFDSEHAINPRVEAFADYKAREDYPREFTPFEWLTTIYAGLDHLSIAWCEAQQWEADDDIATLVSRAGGRQVAIMANDRDFLQLVGRGVRLITTTRTYGVREVVERFAVHPKQWCDYRALTGDASDNIPGIWGIGPKRAAYILHNHRTLETARIPRTWWGERVRDEFESALRWRDLIRLQIDQPVGLEWLGLPTPELPRAADVCDLLDLWA